MCNGNNYETMKVFDSSDLPGDVYEWIADYLEVSNGIYRSWWVPNELSVVKSYRNDVNNWLLENGAELNEQVLIKFSW